jgi:hypothetical protein
MDLGNSITGTLFLLICIVPFVRMNYKRVNKEKKMLRILNENAQQQSCEISQHEFCGDFVLGFDKIKNFVFFLKVIKQESSYQYVDLSKVQTCQAVKSTRTVLNNSESVILTERVELCFSPSEMNRSEIKFELFNDDINKQQSGEIQFADKWTRQISDSLKNKN